MKFFLKKCNNNTLFLIDEFGTGSDPELGGALAESLLESFYEKKSHGVITTHYSNLKALASELSEMTNANMQFNSKTLNPTFKLIMGEAGGSFTFEVAEKNGIPYSLINKAKKKIEKGKVRFDETISKLQKERIKMSKAESVLKEKGIKAQNENEILENLNSRLKKKLVDYQELYDHNQKMIVLGNKINDIAENYFINNRKRILVSELIKVIEIENSKRKEKKIEKIKSNNNKKKTTQKDIDSELIKIRKEKKTLKSKIKNSAKLKVGDQVRLYDGKSIGSIDSINKNKAIVNYGNFVTHVDLNSLELV
jgi:DNA mismatch repair protein MutS2